MWKTRHHAAGGKTRLLDQWEHQGAEVWGLLHTAYWARTVCRASTGARFPVVTVADKLFTLVAHGGSLLNSQYIICERNENWHNSLKTI